MVDVDEVLAWLYAQIDQHDRLNPKYRILWKEIDAIRNAQARMLAASLPPSLHIVRGEAEVHQWLEVDAYPFKSWKCVKCGASKI